MEQNVTNEDIIKNDRFENQFDLVNYAIKLAENMIKTGREPLVKPRRASQNVAMTIIEEIVEGKDQMFDESLYEEKTSFNAQKFVNESVAHGEQQQRKARKIFQE